MLKVIGSMRKIQLATDEASMAAIRAAAGRSGANVDLEQKGNILFGRAIFLGYDLPNGNGDAIPSFYARTFGPSFIDKHLDHEHKEDDANKIGKIYATWHVESEIPVGEGPRIIGRNAFGRDIAGRKPLFRLSGSQGQDVRGAIRELQVEGIFGIDRSRNKQADITARRLLSGEMDSVSQEASTAYCQCSVCAHKIQYPFDPICDHLVSGHLMIRSWKVDGYDDEVLGYKVHQEPVGTGLGVVQVPAFDRAKVAEMTAALKSGQMSIEVAYAMVAEHERLMGREADSNLISAARKDFDLVARDFAKSAPVVVGGEFTEVRAADGEPSAAKVAGWIKAWLEQAEPEGVPAAEDVIVDATELIGAGKGTPAIVKGLAWLKQADPEGVEGSLEDIIAQLGEDAGVAASLKAGDVENPDPTLSGIDIDVLDAAEAIKSLKAKAPKAKARRGRGDNETLIITFPDKKTQDLVYAWLADNGYEEGSYNEISVEASGSRDEMERHACDISNLGPEDVKNMSAEELKKFVDDQTAEAKRAGEPWAAGVKAGSQVTISFQKKDNAKGPQDDEVEATVKPDSAVVAKLLEGAGFVRVSDGVYAIYRMDLEGAKAAFRKAFDAQGQAEVGVSIVEEGPHAMVLEHISPKAEGEAAVSAPVEAALSFAAGQKVFHLHIDTSNFVFDSYGKTAEEAVAAMRKGFDKQLGAEGRGDPEFFKQLLEDYHPTEIELGKSYRDGSILAFKAEPKAVAVDRLMAAILATEPAAGDATDDLVKKIHTAAVIEARLNRETESMVRHAAVAAALEAAGRSPLAALVATASRASELASRQVALDKSKALMAAAVKIELVAGSGEGAIPAWTMAPVAESLKVAKYGSPRFESARAEAERAMPSILGFHSRLTSAMNPAGGKPSPRELAVSYLKADFDDLCRKAQAEAKKPGAFGAAKLEAAAARLAKWLEATAREESLLRFSMPALAAADTELGRQSPSFAARRLRLPEDAMNTIIGWANPGAADGQLAVAKHALSIIARRTSDHLRRPEREAAQVLAAGSPKDSSQAQAQADAMAVLSAAAHDFKGSLSGAARTFSARSIVLSAAMLSEEVRAAAGRALSAAWTRAYDADPSVHPSILASRIARSCKVTRNQALTAGLRLRSAGGMWPWTSQNGAGPESWPQFVEARSDQELEELAKEWQARLKAAVGSDARMVIESNVRRLLSTLDARKQARGCYARLVGSADPLASYWALHAADGSVVLRATVRNIVGSRRDQVAVKWASSPEYGARMEASAAAFGFGPIKASMSGIRRMTATSGVPDPMLKQYLETALWSSSENEEPMDRDKGVDDFNPDAVEKAREDIATFLDEAGALLDGVEADNEQIGHDLWLTRNGHGAGFWDRPELYKDDENAKRLTELAHALGESYPSVGDDEKVHLYGRKVSAAPSGSGKVVPKETIAQWKAEGKSHEEIGRLIQEWDFQEEPAKDELALGYEMVESQGAQSHGYKEFDWEGYLNITDSKGVERGTADGAEDYTADDLAKLALVEADLTKEKWSSGGADGYFHARVDFEDVKSGDLDDFRRDMSKKLADQAEAALRKHFGPDVNISVDEA